MLAVSCMQSVFGVTRVLWWQRSLPGVKIFHGQPAQYYKLLIIHSNPQDLRPNMAAHFYRPEFAGLKEG